MSLRPDPAAFVRPADVWARAIIAAARTFGDDPVAALTSERKTGRSSPRRCLPAACVGIAQATGLTVGRVAPVLALSPAAVRARKTHGERRFKEAVRAAVRAVEYAHWRPEAAESVAASAAGQLDLVGAAGAEADIETAAPSPDAVEGWEAELAQAVASVEAATPPAAHIARPHAPLAGRVNLSNGHAFAPTFRPGPPPPTQSLDGRILAQLAERGWSPRGLASVLDIKEAFVAQTLRNLAREGRVTADDLAPGASDRDQTWRLA